MTTRRGVLQLIGGGVVVAAVAAGGWYLMNGPSTEARQAWREAGTPKEYRRRFLSYALLAPNPHNMQPWRVRLDGADGLTLFCDLDRRLPETDPFDRQTVIGCGAFLELLSLAAAQEGYAAVIAAFPEGVALPELDARPVASVRFLPGAAQPDALFAQITARRTNRNANGARDVPGDLLRQLEAAGTTRGATARTTGDGELAAKLRDISWRGHETESLTHRTMKESTDVMRIGREEANRWRDGLVLEGQMIEFARLTGMVTKEALLDPKSDAFKMGMDQYREKAASARAFAWLTTADATNELKRICELDAGHAYARMTLKAAELGLAVHPWSQSLQEYAEMEGLYREVHDLIGEGRRLQMFVRVGYAEPVIASPRRGVDALFASAAEKDAAG
ncbi:MAG: twin-arginine translocation pathway signal protein [Hyphomonadaceae bacterium]